MLRLKIEVKGIENDDARLSAYSRIECFEIIEPEELTGRNRSSSRFSLETTTHDQLPSKSERAFLALCAANINAPREFAVSGKTVDFFRKCTTARLGVTSGSELQYLECAGSTSRAFQVLTEAYPAFEK